MSDEKEHKNSNKAALLAASSLALLSPSAPAEAAQPDEGADTHMLLADTSNPGKEAQDRMDKLLKNPWVKGGVAVGLGVAAIAVARKRTPRQVQDEHSDTQETVHREQEKRRRTNQAVDKAQGRDPD